MSVRIVAWLVGSVTLLGVGACLLIGCDATIMCVAEGTGILTPEGEVRVETVSVGDVVLSWDTAGNRLVPATVLAVRKGRRSCLSVETAGRKLLVTPNHPLYSTEWGRFVPAATWAAGDRVLCWSGGPGSESVARVSRVGWRTVYDLTVSPPHHNFLANGMVVHNKLPPPDRTPPAAVTDLEVVSAGSTGVRLGWTAPSDETGNGHVGSADSYEIRYDTGGITDSTWIDATRVPASPLPREPGEPDGVQIQGLDPGVQYFFGLKSRDASGNVSALSNIVSARTLEGGP